MALKCEERLRELWSKLSSLKGLVSLGKYELRGEYLKLKEEFREEAKRCYSNLEPWDRVLLARHPERPKTSDYISILIKDFVEFKGDNHFMDDKAIIGGFGWFYGMKVAVLGHAKGRTTKENIERNFGMPHPEGYRKAIRVMELAQRFNLPLITFVDTPGAYPGVGAEERGQSRAIAQCIYTMLNLKVPTLSVIIGEGGSGGALALAVGNRVLMLENSIYSVISPEGCSSILFKSQEKVKEASKMLKLTSYELLELGVIDEVIKEPYGAGHWLKETTVKLVGRRLRHHLKELLKLGREKVLEHRIEKFRSIYA